MDYVTVYFDDAKGITRCSGYVHNGRVHFLLPPRRRHRLRDRDRAIWWSGPEKPDALRPYYTDEDDLTLELSFCSWEEFQLLDLRKEEVSA